MIHLDVKPVAALPALGAVASGDSRPGRASFGETLGAMLDDISHAIAGADALAGSLVVGRAGVADAAVARAKADTILEVAAIAASRASGAIATLLQTQV